MKTSLIRFLTGAVVMVLGLALLLDALDIADTTSILEDWWPSLVIVGGVAMLIANPKNYLWALFVVAIGVLTQLRVLEYIDIDPWQVFWPLVLIVVGVSIIFKRSTVPHRNVEAGSDDIVAILGGSDQKNTSDNFVESKVTAIMGGAKLDLRKAAIKDSATIEIFALMGGVEIVVPRNVVVKNQTNAILGGIENKTDQDVAKNSPTLTVVGDVIMGGIEIKN